MVFIPKTFFMPKTRFFQKNAIFPHKRKKTEKSRFVMALLYDTFYNFLVIEKQSVEASMVFLACCKLFSDLSHLT